MSKTRFILADALAEALMMNDCTTGSGRRLIPVRPANAHNCCRWFGRIVPANAAQAWARAQSCSIGSST